MRPRAATDTTSETALPQRLMVFDLDTLALLNELSGVGGQASRLIQRQDTGSPAIPRRFQVRHKDIDEVEGQRGGTRPGNILFDAFSERVFVFSHPTKNATVINTRDARSQGRSSGAAHRSKVSRTTRKCSE